MVDYDRLVYDKKKLSMIFFYELLGLYFIINLITYGNYKNNEDESYQGYNS